MKKNITINLFGTLYNIDEDAYELLDRYVESMKRYFRNRSGGEEIADDIEHRVAELLWEHKESGAQTVDIQTVKDIIAKIGNPAEIDMEGDAMRQDDSSQRYDRSERSTDSRFTGSEGQAGSSSTSKNWFDEISGRLRNHFRGRRLYRDPDDKVLGGICSGFAQYIGGIDPLPWRLVMVFLFFFTRLSVGVLYILLWLLVPEARTPEERLRMRGCPVTPENLNQEILRQSEPNQSNGNSKNVWIAVLVVLFILFCIVPLVFGGWFLTHGPSFMQHMIQFMDNVTRF